MTGELGWSNPLNVAPSTSGDGSWFWVCYPCLDRDPADGKACGREATPGAAGDAARHHHRTECPIVREATNRLLDDVLQVPTFRPMGLLVPGVGWMHLFACLSCGRLVPDMGAHVERHLDDRDRREAADHG